MLELNDIAQQEQPDFEPRSRTVSFPDNYLIPYIQWCKNSKRITCGCSIMFIGLAIFCFFATNYMLNYPVTEARKIAFVFAAVFCLVAATSCLNLRFRIFNQCRNGSNNTLFEIVHREDTVLSDSFSGHFEMQEAPFRHGTPKEGPSQAYTPGESSSLAHSVDESYSARISTFKNNGQGRLPRHSISHGQDIPLLPLRRPLESSSSSGMQNKLDSKRLEIGGTVYGSNRYPPNYSTFENSSAFSKTQLRLSVSTFEDSCDISETDPSMSESTFENSCDVSEAEPLLAESTFQNGCDVSESEALLTESPLENGCEVHENEPLLAESTFKNDCDVSETEKLLSEKF